MARRCVWCNRADDPLESIQVQTREPLQGSPTEKEVSVHPIHENAVRRYYAERRTHAATSFSAIVGITGGLMVISVVALVVLGAFPDAAGVTSVLLLACCGLALAGIGGTMIARPFSTPETISLFGIRRSKQIMRGVGIVCIGAGVGLGVWPLWM
jgi:hypothetical protein